MSDVYGAALFPCSRIGIAQLEEDIKPKQIKGESRRSAVPATNRSYPPASWIVASARPRRSRRRVRRRGSLSGPGAADAAVFSPPVLRARQGTTPSFGGAADARCANVQCMHRTRPGARGVGAAESGGGTRATCRYRLTSPPTFHRHPPPNAQRNVQSCTLKTLRVSQHGQDK